MVLLIMTTAVVDALRRVEGVEAKDGDATHKSDGVTADDTNHGATDAEPDLNAPAAGKPISHGQIVHLWQRLQTSDHAVSLERLLRGSHIYVPPPPPKAEPTPEFKALMARLRRDEEARSYERMINPPERLESTRNRFTSTMHAYAQVNQPASADDIGDSEVTMNDVHRQVMLIFNFMVSILGVAGTLWVLARWWSTPARLFLTMGGSILVGIAEVAVYSTYVWRMTESKAKQDQKKEVKEVVNTWTVGRGYGDGDGDGGGDGEDEKTVLLKSKEDDADGTVRKRNAIKQEP